VMAVLSEMKKTVILEVSMGSRILRYRERCGG